MVSAVVLITCERNQIVRVAEQMAEIDGISEVFSVAGRYDLVAILRVPTNAAHVSISADGSNHISTAAMPHTRRAWASNSRPA